MPIKLGSKEYKVIALAVAVAGVSLAVSLKYFWQAFPEATLDLRVNREGSAEIARKFLGERGARLDGYRHAAIFSFDDDAKLYLERTKGLGRMNELTRGPIRLWRWSHRWFKPQQKEEFRAEVAPTGEVVGFDHEIPEAAAGANLDQEQAREISERFLREVIKRDLNDLEFVEARSNKRPARTDHSFIWKQKSVALGDGSLRVQVGISGDQVSGYQEFVKIPEQWSRDYEKLRSRNESAQIVDEVFWVLLSVAMLVMLILRLRDRDVPVLAALGFGGVAAILFFLGQVNTFSLSEFSYPTTDPYASFLANYLTSSALRALLVGTFIFLLVAGAEPVYREGFPALVSIRRYLSWQGLRTRSFFTANVVGIGLTFFFFAYQTVFYLVADKLGAWAPSDIPFTNELNTRIPWVSVLFVGFFPAVSEEMQFRAFAIPFLRKILRSLPLAVVLAAFNWGFLHAAYPNQPFFIRGIEVGVGGIVTGLIMLRFGIMATLIWHYSVDALYTAFLLLRSSNHYLMVSGGITAGIMVIPLAAAVIAYWRTGTFTEESALTNAREGVARLPRKEADVVAETPLAYNPLAQSRLVLAAVLAAVFIGLAAVPVYRFGEGIKVRVTRPEAVRAADAYLEKRHVSVASYRSVAWIQNTINPLALRYLLERRSIKESDQIYRQATRLLLWEVRYFRPLEKEEHRVYVDATNGEVFGHRCILDENAPGASLSASDARALTEKAIAEQGYRPSDFELKDSQAEKRKAREDYTFVWQARPGDPRNVGEAHYRLEVEVAGDQVVSFSRLFKLPEDWERERGATRLPNAILTGLSWLLRLGLVGAAVILFVVQLRRGLMPWRPAAGVGVLFAITLALSELNRISVLARAYSTSIPLSTFWLGVGVSLVVAPILAGLGGWVLVALATSLYPDAWRVFRPARRVWRRDAAVATVVYLAAVAALNRLSAMVSSGFHAYVPVNIELAYDVFDASSPGLAFFFHSLLLGISLAAAAAVAIYLVRWGWARREWWIWPGALPLLISLGPQSAHSPREFLLGWAMGFLTLLVTVAIIGLFFRDNALAYLLAPFCLAIANPLVSLFSQPAKFFHWNGLLLAALALTVLGWAMLPRTKASKSAE